MWLWVIHKNYRPYGFVPVLRSKLPLNWELFSQPWLSQVPVTSISDTVAIHVCVSGEYHDRIDILWLSTSWGVVFTLSNCIQVCQLIVWSSWVACCVLLCLLIIGLFSCGVCQPVLHATLCTSSLPGEVFVSCCNCYCYECLMKTMLVVLVSKCQTLVQIVFTGGRTLRASADMGRTLRIGLDMVIVWIWKSIKLRTIRTLWIRSEMIWEPDCCVIGSYPLLICQMILPNAALRPDQDKVHTEAVLPAP